MRRFSILMFVASALLHFIVSGFLVGGAVAASYAQERGVPDHSTVWIVGLWIWDTVPMLLAPFFQPLRSIHVLYLLLPWSLFAGVCCGFLLPRLWAARGKTA